ncbi:hypothetical protein CPC16_004747 [Podila verticillata]|nr:hypothetical protein CPC16_004747 [Podila verticillata]
MASSTRIGLSSIAGRDSDIVAVDASNAVFQTISTLDSFDSVSMLDKETTLYLNIFLETDPFVQETPSVSEEILRQQELEARVAAAERDDVLDSEWVYPQSQGDEDTAEDETEDEVKEQEITNIEYVEVLMVDPEMAYAQGTTLRVFDYTLGWTEGMVFLLSFCLGGTLVGLAQTRTLIRQMSEEMGGTGSASQRRHVSLLVGGIISMTAMSLTAWVIMEELWTSPPEYFAGFGIAGVILVQVWVPDAPLQVALDSIDTKRYNFGDEEKVVGTLERRNACSLDVNSRAELATTNSKVKE